jgi:hypothetical protein
MRFPENAWERTAPGVRTSATNSFESLKGNGIESGFWERKMRRTDARSAKKNPGRVCAFCVSSFAPFVFPDRVIH